MLTKTIKCPNCGALVTNTMNCEYCDSILVRFADEEQKDDLAEFKSIIASEDETMVMAAASVLKKGIWTEEHSTIAMAWFVDGSSEELIEYKEGEIMIVMIAERGEDFFEKYKLIPALILKLFVLEKTELKEKYNLDTQVRTYKAHLGKDFNDAAVIWLKVMRAVADARGVHWIPNEIRFENKFGLYNYKGERIGDSTMGEDIFCTIAELDSRGTEDSESYSSVESIIQEDFDFDDTRSTVKNWLRNNKKTIFITVSSLIIVLFLVAGC